MLLSATSSRRRSLGGAGDVSMIVNDDNWPQATFTWLSIRQPIFIRLDELRTQSLSRIPPKIDSTHFF